MYFLPDQYPRRKKFYDVQYEVNGCTVLMLVIMRPTVKCFTVDFTSLRTYVFRGFSRKLCSANNYATHASAKCPQLPDSIVFRAM